MRLSCIVKNSRALPLFSLTLYQNQYLGINQRNDMSEYLFAIFATIYIFLIFMIIIICIYFDYILAANQGMELENILRNCANQVDPDQENFETDNVDIPPPYLNF